LFARDKEKKKAPLKERSFAALHNSQSPILNFYPLHKNKLKD
jgi:hypothetical protein